MQGDLGVSNLQVLMPMGGLGSRFANQGYTTPKPLISVDGKPMFMRALDSFKTVENVTYIFVIRKEHNDAYDLANKIYDQISNARIAILDHNTDGAVATCMIAKDLIDNELPITIADCDIYFESKQYFEVLKPTNLKNMPDGMLLTFEAHDPRYSYAELNAAGQVVRTAEKIVISSHAILGGYFFRSGELFKKLANTFLKEPLPPGLKEYYLSHLFNILLEQQGQIQIAHTDTMFIFGTPEELNAYFLSHPQ